MWSTKVEVLVQWIQKQPSTLAAEEKKIKGDIVKHDLGLTMIIGDAGTARIYVHKRLFVGGKPLSLYTKQGNKT